MKTKKFIVEIECSRGNGKPTVQQFNQVLENTCFTSFRDNISKVTEITEEPIKDKLK